MKEALANIYRELSAGRIGRDEALDRIRALKHGGREDAVADATVLAEPTWVAAALPEGQAMPFPRRRVLLSGWTREAGDALAQGIADAACLVVDDAGLAPAQRYAQAALRGFAELRDLLDARNGGQDRGRALVQWVVADDGDDAQLLAGLDGLFESAALEQPNLCGQIVFVPKDIAPSELARLLAAEATSSPERVVRHGRDGRQARRWRMTGDALVGAAEASAQRSGLRERGVYLVTGGLGGLGLLVAAHLRALVPSATLVLCGRSAPQGDAADALSRLQAQVGAGQVESGIVAPGTVEYRQADVADAMSASALVDGIVRDHGALHGIFHGAGLLRDDFLQKKTADRFAEVLAPKVAGAVALDAASAQLDLDLFVLSGSIASWAGNLGQTDYAAANGFLDAFSGWRAAQVAKGERRGRSLTLAWPHWIEGGMHVDAESLRRLEQRTGLRSMDTGAGLRALHAALAMPQPALMVMHGQREAMREALATRRLAVDSTPAKAADIAKPAAAPPADLASRLRAFLRDEFSAVLKIPAQRIELRAALEQYGIDSILAMSLTGRLEDSFGVLPKTLFFEYQTIDELAGYFEARHADALARLFAQAPSTSAAPAASASVSTSTPATQLPMPQRPARGRRRTRDAARMPSPSAAFATVDAPIAIVGLSGRYPQSPDLDAFWRNLRDGRDCITEVPASRWDWQQWYSEDATREGAHLSRWGGFIEGVDEFDPRFFNISPREAIGIDPQERLFLQHAWLALEDAGLTRAALQVPDAHGLPGQVGVYAGVMYGEYSLSGSLASIANRVSYFLNLHGPSLTLDTMCSSSLTALHLACQDLRLGRTSLALAGGVNVSVHPNKYTMLSGGQFISRDGHCQSFGEGGDGYIPGEGVGIAVLKRLADAERDGDRILGVIRATALNHGGKTNGYTVPNPQAQADVIARALREAGVDARHVSYIEAHGTGTKLGDPIEINALSRAFHAQGSEAAQDAGWCLIGSAKSNIGHCESAAGIAGVTKVLLQMRHGQVVPSLHSRTLNPHIDFAATPFEVVQTLRPWPRPVVDGIERPRIAGISSFGAGGSNAHVLIEEYRAAATVADEAMPVLVPLSARTPEQLLQRARDLCATLNTDEPLSLDALAWTLQTGREAMEVRLAIVARSRDDLRAALDAVVAGRTTGAGTHRALVRDHRDEIATLDDDRSGLDAALAQGDVDTIATWWTKGAAIDWTQLRAGRPAPRRLALPGYPFARERYWRDPVAAAAKAALSPGASAHTAVDVHAVAALHPLVHRNRSGLDGLRFESVFAVGDPALIDGALPDAQLPAMALAALDLAAPQGTDPSGDDTHWALDDVAWGVPAADVVGRALQVSLLPRGAGEIALEIHGADGTQVYWQAIATRSHGARTALPTPPTQTVAAVEQAPPAAVRPIVALAPIPSNTTAPALAPAASVLRELPLASPSAVASAAGAEPAPTLSLGPVPAKPTNIALHASAEVSRAPVEAKGRVRLAALSAVSAQVAEPNAGTPVRLFDAGEGLRIVRIEASLTDAAEALAEALRRAGGDEGVRTIRIEGTHVQAWQGGRATIDALIRAGVFKALADIATPTLAVVAGHARGAGLLLASACTLLVADEDGVFGFTDPDTALFPTVHEDRWFRARLGDALADDLLYRQLDRAGRALREAGWSARFVSAEDVVASADALCASLSTKSPLALGLLAGHLARDLSPLVAALNVATAFDTAESAPQRDVLCLSLCEDAAPDALLSPLFDAIARAGDDTAVASIVLACSAPGGLPETLPAETLDRAIDAVLRSRVPVVAALDGDTGGAGWLLALACDAVVLRSDAACTTSMHWHDPALRDTVVALASLRLPVQLARRLSFAGGHCTAEALSVTGVRVADDALLAAQALAAGWNRWPEAVLSGWKSAQAARHDALRDMLREAAAERPSVVHDAAPDTFASPVVDLTLRDDGVAVIALHDREARNMFTPALVAGLRDAFAAAEAAPDCRAIVITGYDSYFATGGTVDTLLAIQDGQSRFTDETVFQRALDCPLPVVAAIQGHGIGGGWSFGMFADLVLLSAESRYLSPYMGYGFTPGAGSTMTFPLRIGYDLARETLLTAEEIGGHVLRDRGVSLPVLPRREVPEAAITLASAIATRPRAELVALKRLWTQAMRTWRDAVYARELDMHAKTFVGNVDTLATIRARFATPQVSVAEASASQGTSAATQVVTPVSTPVPTAAVDASALGSKLAEMLAQELFLSADEIDPDAPFIDLGLDSITGVTWIRRINAEYGTDIEATKVYSHPTVRRLAALVIAELGATGQGSTAALPVAAGPAPAATPAPVVPAPRTTDPVPALVDTLRAMLAQELFLQPNEIDEDTPFIDLGLDSITGVTWVRRINAEYGVDIEATQVYSHPTLRRLATLVASALPQTAVPVTAIVDEPASVPVAPTPVAHTAQPLASPSRTPLTSWRSASSLVQAAVPAAEQAPVNAMTRPVAIIGEAGRFPQAPDLDAFWRNLAEGRVCIGEVGPERWSLDAHYREGAPTAGYTNSKWLGALEDFDRFDPLFFNISPTEAESMDPQQRVFLQACWHALENAGRDPHGLSGARCGVFVGCGPSDYHQAGERHRLSAQGFTGAATSILAARIAYFLDLRGPCVSIDTACSSSLVAIAQACDSLNSGQSDLALAGGVYVMAGPSMHIMTAQAGMLSADGRCHTFDAGANGFVPGEGVGVVVLKRLEDAQRDGDRIDAVIEGWGVNQDGRSNGITAPNQDAQTDLLQSVYRRFGIDPDGLQLIEAHGTGTKLGDPIEVAGLKAAFAPFTQRTGFCALGSVKSNIGHCLTAAGIAGVLKLVLALRHRQLPPTVNFQRLNEHIQLDGSPFQVNAQLRDWSVPADTRRRSAVSSFGFSGTNAHLVVSEAITEAAATPRIATGPLLVPLSARTAAQLRESVRALLARLDTQDAATLDLQAIAWTLQRGRHAMGERVCFLVHDIAGLREALAACLDERAQPGVRFEGQVKRDRVGLGLLLQDEDVRATVIGKWLSERRHDRLGDVWAKGLDLDWRLLQPEAARLPSPLPLPGYPFARDRYWLPIDDTAITGLSPAKTSTAAALSASKPQAKAMAPMVAATVAATTSPATIATAIDPLSYIGEWLAVEPAIETSNAAARTVLIVSNGHSHGLDETLRLHHAGTGAQVDVIALDGDDAALLSDDDALAARLRPLQQVDAVYMLAIETNAPLAADDATLSAALDRNEGFLLRLVKTLRREALVGDQVDAWVITAGTRSDRNEDLHWWGAGATGLVHALAQGSHRFRLRSIDLSPDELGRSGGAAALLPAILREPPSDRGEAVRLRHGRRERLSFLNLARERSVPTALRHGGVYVVIGGSGIVGRIVSKRLLRDYAAQVVWIGRSAPDSDKVRAALADVAGTAHADHLRYFQADAVDEAALRAAFAEVRAAHPRIHGVFFSGMVVGADDTIERIDPAAFRDIVDVKVRGCRALHAALANESLDFLCHFSSGQSYAFSGATRLSAYASGIAFADSFVRAAAVDAPFPVGIVNWGFWRSAVTERVQKMDGISTRSIHALEDEEGFACLERFLSELQAGRLTQVLCMRAAPEVEALMRCDRTQALCLADAAPAVLLDAAGIAIDDARIAARIEADARHGLETLFVRLLYRSLRAMAGERDACDADRLQRACGITGKYLPWLRQSLSLLQAAGLVDIDREGVIDWREAESPALAEAAWADWNDGRQMRSADPAIGALVALVDECLQRLPEILRGTLAATDVIFPRGSMDKVGGLYRKNPTADTFNEIVAATVVTWVRERLAADPGARLRILEVGAGTGGTSAPVLAALAPYRDTIAEYAYTDLSIAFFQHAERVHAPGNPFLACRRLDIEQPIEAQGFAPGSYDLVLSTNALHATRNIRRTLRHVKSALRRDGLLVISEMCAARLATHLIFGLLDGWWLSEDPELRIPGNPGLAPDGWRSVLASEGFRRILLPGAQAQALGNQVIVAASDGAYRGQRAIDAVVPASVAPVAQARLRAPASTQVQAPPPPVDTRDPETIAREGVLDALSVTLKLDPVQVDPDLAFSDYGIDSILGVAFIERVNARFGLSLNTAIVFEYASVTRLAAYLAHAWRGHLHAPVETPAPVSVSAVESIGDPAEHHLDELAADDVETFVRDTLRDALSATLKIAADDIDPDLAFSDYGIDSILGVNFIHRVNAAFSIELNTAIVFEFASLERLARHLLAAYTDRVRDAARPARTHAPLARVAPMITGSVSTAQAGASLPAQTIAAGTGEIAIIGMSGQFPKAANIEAFWRNLVDGVDGVDELPSHYLDQAVAWSADKRKGFTRCKWGGVLEDRDCFDPLFFSISPKEAESMNPHQRLVMQEGWNALEDAGYDPKRLAGSQTSVFVGAEPAGYIGNSFTGLSDAIVASRLSYVLDLRGAAFVINTGCSASAVAIHLGCESLRNGESSLVLAGGVNACVNQDMLVRLDQIEMLSPSGRCFTFDKGGDGTIISEGVAMLVLKRLEDAEADGDRILATICASGINQDGASNGITAPNGAAQEALIVSTYERFGIDARDISYVEAHGTGTRLGDPVETNALVRAFRRYGDENGWCAIGSAKSHVGHAAAAAGAIGVAKVLLSMRHRLHPKLLNFRERNPLIEFDASPFRIVERATSWDSPPGVPRMAALNSFGHSGTNAHLVLKEYLAAVPAPMPALPQPVAVPLSARTPEQLRQRVVDLLARLDAEDAPDSLASVAWTLQVGREPMEERLGIAAASLFDLRESLRGWLAGRTSTLVFEGRAARHGALHRPAPGAAASELLQRWAVDGQRVDWEGSWQGTARPLRVGLPGYPFAKERYWMASALPGIAAGTVETRTTAAQATATTGSAPVADADLDTILGRIADDALSTQDGVRMLKSLVHDAR